MPTRMAQRTRANRYAQEQIHRGNKQSTHYIANKYQISRHDNVTGEELTRELVSQLQPVQFARNDYKIDMYSLQEPRPLGASAASSGVV